MARQLDFIIDKKVLLRVVKALDLQKEVRIRVRFTAAGDPGRFGSILGGLSLAPGVHQINLETNAKFYRSAAMLDIQREARLTLLHEIKHAQQHEQWNTEEWTKDNRLPYILKRSEVEAEGWAKENYSKYKDILKIKTKHVGRKLP